MDTEGMYPFARMRQYKGKLFLTCHSQGVHEDCIDFQTRALPDCLDVVLQYVMTGVCGPHSRPRRYLLDGQHNIEVTASRSTSSNY